MLKTRSEEELMAGIHTFFLANFERRGWEHHLGTFPPRQSVLLSCEYRLRLKHTTSERRASKKPTLLFSMYPPPMFSSIVEEVKGWFLKRNCGDPAPGMSLSRRKTTNAKTRSKPGRAFIH